MHGGVSYVLDRSKAEDLIERLCDIECDEDELEELQAEVSRLEDEVSRLENTVNTLEAANEKLNAKIIELFESTVKTQQPI